VTAALSRVRSPLRRLARASRSRVRRLAHGPDRLAVPRELVREGMFFTAGRAGPTVEVRWPSGRFLVATADMDVSRRTFVTGPYGIDRLQRAAALIEQETGRGIRGREMLEIGANIGTTTVPLITVCGAAHVHAFEPMPRNLELLERNIELNGLGEQVTVHAAAVSDHIGSVALTIPDRFWGSSRIGASDGERTQTARCLTIDSLLADGTIDGTRLALVWIDVEGHETAVLAGATKLPPTATVLEYDPAQQADLANFHSLIGQASLYDLATGQPTTLEQLQRANATKPTDLLLLPQP
jgi:FkbM family methyltransferase